MQLRHRKVDGERSMVEKLGQETCPVLTGGGLWCLPFFPFNWAVWENCSMAEIVPSPTGGCMSLAECKQEPGMVWMRGFEDIFGIPEASHCPTMGKHCCLCQQMAHRNARGCTRRLSAAHTGSCLVVPKAGDSSGPSCVLSTISPCTAFVRVECWVIPPLLSLCRRRLEIKLGK